MNDRLIYGIMHNNNRLSGSPLLNKKGSSSFLFYSSKERKVRVGPTVMGRYHKKETIVEVRV